MKAGQGQTTIDVALERSGRASEAWRIAEGMGVSLTDLIETRDTGGSVAVRNKQVVKQYARGGTRPSTEMTEGIGGWRVGNFVIG